MTEQFVRTVVDEDRHLGRLILDRAPVNAWTYDFLDQLGSAIESLRLEEAVNVILVESAHDVFCAGGDLKWYANKSNREMRNFVIKVHETLAMFENTPKLVIAGMNGAAMGGGLELALACDFRYLSDDAMVGQVESTIGAVPGGGGTQRLPRTVGRSTAMELIITGRRLEAAEALELGIVHEVFEVEGFDEVVEAKAAEFARGPAHAYGLSKQAIGRGTEMDLTNGLWFEWAMTEAVHETEDYYEGTGAFREGRSPEFKGR